jgi:hypothetical protein
MSGETTGGYIPSKEENGNAHQNRIRNSSAQRVVGNIPEAEKKQILRDMGERFNDQTFEDLKDKEREKRSEELQIIGLANEVTNEVRRKYGLEDIDIPSDNIHVIDQEAWPPEEKGRAFHNSMFQAVLLREEQAKTVFLETVFHEMIHFKSYNALQVSSGENPELDEYRLGLIIHTRDGKEKNFTNLNEAVTEEVTKRYVPKLFNNPIFAEELEQTRLVRDRNQKAVTSSGEPLFDDDTFYAQEKLAHIETEGFSYQLERKNLNLLIDKIFKRNIDKFQDREEVFEVFAKGMLTGNILPVGRLIETTFGKGTLRHIGELDDNIQAQEEFISFL